MATAGSGRLIAHSQSYRRSASRRPRPNLSGSGYCGAARDTILYCIVSHTKSAYNERGLWITSLTNKRYALTMLSMVKPVEAHRRTITLGVRVSPEERAAIERAAAREYRRISDFVRVVVLKTLQDETTQEVRHDKPGSV